LNLAKIDFDHRMRFPLPGAVLDPQALEELLAALEQRPQSGDQQGFAETPGTGKKIKSLGNACQLVNKTGLVHINKIALDHLGKIVNPNRQKLFHLMLRPFSLNLSGFCFSNLHKHIWRVKHEFVLITSLTFSNSFCILCRK
jgi:hypothetical protein